MATQEFELEDRTFEGQPYCIRGKVIWDDSASYDLYCEDLALPDPTPIQPSHEVQIEVVEMYDEATQTWSANPDELARLKDNAALHIFILDILMDEACAAAEKRDEQRRES